ncbi:hypothetical protein C818_00914 [Lachnospiraceae bacterium MD308]|nr:hypothetical protein C818_00914 [Lachnospiraceae bacterium MD308]
MKIRRKKIVNTICLALAGCLFYTGSSQAAEGSEYVFSKSEPVIRMEKNVQRDITTEDIETALEIAESKKKNEICIVSNDTLAEKDLFESVEKALFVYDNGKVAGVEVNPEILEKIDSEIVQDIVDSETVGDGDYVTISDYKEAGELDEEGYDEDDLKTETISPKGYGYTYRNGKIINIGKPYKDKDKLITSVAKGQEKVLSSKVTLTCKRELGGEYYTTSVASGISASVTFKSQVKYASRNMEAGKNCRKFYIRSYKQKCKRTQSKINAKTNAVIGTKTAIIKKPAHSIEYSVDVKIS